MTRSAYLNYGAELDLSEAHMDRLADYKGLPSQVSRKNDGYPEGAVFYTSRPDSGASRK